MGGSVNRLLFIASPSPYVGASTGGSPMVAESLMTAFAQAGWETAYVGLVKPERWPAQPTETARYHLHRRTQTEQDIEVIRHAITDAQPTVIYCYGYEAVALAYAVGGATIPIVATTYEPWYRRIWEGHSWWGRLRQGRYLWRAYRQFLQEELPALVQAQVVITHVAAQQPLYTYYLGQKVRHFPNPLLPVNPLPTSHGYKPPSFVFTGHLKGTATAAGMEYLVTKLLPYCSGDLSINRYQWVIIGGGELPSHLAHRLTTWKVPNVTFTGYLSHTDLMTEYQHCHALVVPTPIGTGFRTRILDAWRYGLPVIAHTANTHGFAALVDNENCLLATTPEEFRTAIRRIVDSPALRTRLAATALHQFTQFYAATHYVEFLTTLLAQGSGKPPFAPAGGVTVVR